LRTQAILPLDKTIDPFWDNRFSSLSKTKKERMMFNLKAYPPIERNADGSLIRMKLRQSWAVKRIIREHCCNLQDERNCLLLDDGEEVTCPQLRNRSVCCTFFRNVLLKLAEAAGLEAEIFHEDNVRLCARCGKPYIAHGNRAKYCDECKVITKKEQQAEYARRKRARRRKIEI